MKSITQQSLDPDWAAYYKATRHTPPRPLLIKALHFVDRKYKAIDIGGGALNDTRYLLNEGFNVTVIDKSPLLAEMASSIPSSNLRAVVSLYEDFDFGENHYDLASAMFALPFNPPQSFERIFCSIKQSLVVGGVFCGQFFGQRDEWARNEKMTFHTREEIESLLGGMEAIQVAEKEEDGTTATGSLKHWHLFHVIAKKQ